MDAWPLPGSGLPARVVNRCREAGLATVGELRRLTAERIERLPGIRAASLRRIRAFLDLCDRLESGARPLPDLPAVMAWFLKPDERTVLAARFCLDRAGAPAGSRPPTLRAIGAARAVTRERVRQMQRRATAALASSLAQACLAPLYEAFEAFLRARAGLAAEQEAARADFAGLGGCDAAGALRLLCACSARIRRRGNLFTTLPEEELAAAERALRAALRAAPRPLRPEDAAAALPPRPDRDPAAARRLAGCLLENMPDVAVLADGRCFDAATGAADLAVELARAMPRPVRLRDLRQRYNALMRPGSRKGAGFILGILSHDRRFRRQDVGLYDLREADPCA